jgi:AcrR family transcriptional regulator
LSATDTPGKRERTKLANRAAILEAAREVFVDLGYGAATVRDVIRRTDLASGTFYNYFPDKEAVFRALVQETAREAAERAHVARRRGTTLDAFVTDGFRAYFELLARDRATFELVRRNAGTIRAMFDVPAIAAGITELADDLREGIAAGFVPEHDTRLMAAAMVGTAFEVGVRMLDDEPPDVDGAATFCGALFLGGLDRLSGGGAPGAQNRSGRRRHP